MTNPVISAAEYRAWIALRDAARSLTRPTRAIREALVALDDARRAAVIGRGYARGQTCATCGADDWCVFDKVTRCRPCSIARNQRLNARRWSRKVRAQLGG